MTKNDMAREITQVLMNMSVLPPANHWHVKREERSLKHHLVVRHQLAMEVKAARQNS